MKKEKLEQLNRKFKWSDVNGLFLVAAVLGGTILLAGATEARLQKAEAELAKSEGVTKLAHCPIGQYPTNSTIR